MAVVISGAELSELHGDDDDFWSGKEREKKDKSKRELFSVGFGSVRSRGREGGLFDSSSSSSSLSLFLASDSFFLP